MLTIQLILAYLLSQKHIERVIDMPKIRQSFETVNRHDKKFLKFLGLPYSGIKSKFGDIWKKFNLKKDFYSSQIFFFE